MIGLVGDGADAYVQWIGQTARAQNGGDKLCKAMRVEKVQGHSVSGLPLPLLILRIKYAFTVALVLTLED